MGDYQDALVSAVIITYRRPLEILKRSVSSALGQTHQNMEVIVVNDDPDDQEREKQVREFIASFQDDRLRYILHEKNSGACKARNTGIRAAKGEFIGLLDDDDEWLPKKTEAQLRGFTSEEIGLVYSPFYNITAEPPGEIIARSRKSGDLFEDMLWDNRLGGSSMTLVRRSVYEDVGLFDEELLSSQDYDMWLRITEKYQVAFVDEVGARRYLMDDSITKNFEKKKKGFYAFYHKHQHFYDERPAVFNYVANRTAGKWYEMGHFKEAGEIRRAAFKAKPFSRYNLSEPLKGIIKRIFGIRRY